MFNPFKYRYDAFFLREENGEALVKLSKGADEAVIRIPRRLLPEEIQSGESFILSFQTKDLAKKEESESLKQLLQELIV